MLIRIVTSFCARLKCVRANCVAVMNTFEWSAKIQRHAGTCCFEMWCWSALGSASKWHLMHSEWWSFASPHRKWLRTVRSTLQSTQTSSVVWVLRRASIGRSICRRKIWHLSQSQRYDKSAIFVIAMNFFVRPLYTINTNCCYDAWRRQKEIIIFRNHKQ